MHNAHPNTHGVIIKDVVIFLIKSSVRLIQFSRHTVVSPVMIELEGN